MREASVVAIAFQSPGPSFSAITSSPGYVFRRNMSDQLIGSILPFKQEHLVGCVIFQLGE